MFLILLFHRQTKMSTIHDIPVEILYVLIRDYVSPRDYMNCLLVGSFFHILSPEERSHRYREILIFKKYRRHEQQKCERFDAITSRMDQQKIKDRKFYQCPGCWAVIRDISDRCQRHVPRCPKDKAICEKGCGSIHHSATSWCPVDTPILCNNEGCGVRTERWRMWMHALPCLRTLTSCKGCGFTIIRENVSIHRDTMCLGNESLLCCYGCGFHPGNSDIGETKEEHEDKCGTRTIFCVGCKRHTTLKNIRLHRYKKVYGRARATATTTWFYLCTRADYDAPC